jgi:hypothetical protein
MYQRYLSTNPSAEARALAETHLASVERCRHKIALHIPVENTPGQLSVPSPTGITELAPPVGHRAQLEKNVGIGLAIGGSVGLAAAVYFTIQAHDAENDVAAAYANGAQWKDVAPIDQRGRTAATEAKIAGIAGTLGLAGGIVTYLVGRHNEHPPLTVAPTSHGVAVSMLWAF